MAATAATPYVMIRPPGTTIGFPGIRPCSLPEATREPVNVTQPMITSRTVGMVNCSERSSLTSPPCS